MTSSPGIILSASDLSKRYGTFAALSSASFDLHAGEITTLSGPNGSGKTTLLTCLAGLIQPTTGSVSVEGFDLSRDERQVRRRMIFVPDVPRFYLELTAWEHLRFIALANNAADRFEQRAAEILARFDLWEARDLFPHHYSRGMRLKLGLAMALIRPFKVILLDEPTSALDAAGVEVLIAELARLRLEGVAVLVSSHDPGLIDQISDRQMVLHQGSLEFRK